MQTATLSTPVARNTLWAGRILGALPVLFMLFDSVIKVIQIDPVVEAFTRLGYPVSLAPVIGILALACVVVYVIPRTSVLGAILLTGYLGGEPQPTCASTMPSSFRSRSA